MEFVTLHGATQRELDRFKQKRGIEYLRQLVATFDKRPEYLNDPKSVDRLIAEFDDYCMELSNVQGEKYIYLVYNATGYLVTAYDNERAAQIHVDRRKTEYGDDWTYKEEFLANRPEAE